MIFDIGIDSAAVPEGVVPAVIEGRTPTSKARIEEAAPAPVRPKAVRSSERIGDDADLAFVDPIAELDAHARALQACCRRVAARLQLLRNDRRIALELEPAARGHAFAGDDHEGLALRRRHRLV